MTKTFVIALLFAFFAGAGRSEENPVLFAPGQISTGDYESHPALTADGKTIYFLKNAPDFSFWTIVFSHYKDGSWTEPQIAPFSGQYADADPFLSEQDSVLYFISNRPVEGKEPNMDIWMVKKEGESWGTPVRLPEPINSPGHEWYPTLAADGTLYFGSDRTGGKGRTDLYRARFENGKYSEPENLGEIINTEFEEFEPWIAPDQNTLLFMSVRKGGIGAGDLYISCNRNGTWTEPKNLGPKINSPGMEYSPKISPDGRFFLYTSTRGFGREPNAKPLTYQQLLQKIRGPQNGLGDIYQVAATTLPKCADQ